MHARLPLYLVAHQRLLLSAALGAVVGLLIPQGWGPITRALLGWDFGALAFLLLIVVMIVRSTGEHIRMRAALQDAGRWVVLILTVAGVLFSLLAIAFIQHHLKSSTPGEAGLYFGLIAATILLSWLLAHTMFALHYAHDYYGPAVDLDDADGLIGGLEFPSCDAPDYWDFLYFSFVIGMTCQVSDVQVSGQGIRRVALAHGVVSFFFNTIILAFTVNIAASAVQG